MSEVAQQYIAALEKRVGPDAKSPRFAQLAYYYLEANRPEDALRICDAGLAHHPFYTTAHLIKGKALAALHMRAEARREFEFVLQFLPRNETVASLLEHLPPGEDETLTATHHVEQVRIIKPEPPPPRPAESKIIQPPAPASQDTGFGFGGFDQPAVEQHPEPAPAVLSGPSFFEAITQAPAPSPAPVSDPFGLSTQTVEAPTIPEPSSFGGFGVQAPEAPTIPQEDITAFADIPRTVPPPDTFEITLPSEGFIGTTPAPSEEESFEQYASRRRAELSGEDTVSLENYLDNIEVPFAMSPESPTSIIPPPEPQAPEPAVPEAPIIDIPLTFSFERKARDSYSAPAPIESEVVQPEIQLPSFSLSLEPEGNSYSPPSIPSEPEINLQPASPAELPMSPDIQNDIEQIASKLQTAGKITPVIDMAQKETPPASEQDLPMSMGFVTPTLAEIYAKQGWYDDAIKAYRALAHNKPHERERFEKRIEELEKLKSQGSK